LEKAWRWADQMGARLNKDRVRRSSPPSTIRAVIGELEALAQWCDDLAGAAGQLTSSKVPHPPTEVGITHAYSK
jgi:hypothetical protein